MLIPDRRSSDSLGAQATQLLRNEILNWRFPQGTRLNELRLANEFALSRGPIREALRGLEREGLVVSLPHRGSYVVRVGCDHYAEILDLREVLEPYAYERSTERRTHRLAGPLLAVTREMRGSVERKEWAALSAQHAEFHGIVYHEGGGRMLTEVWHRIEAPLRIFLQGQHWTTEAATEFVDRHQALADKLITGERITGREAIIEHLRESRRQLPFPFSGVVEFNGGESG